MSEPNLKLLDHFTNPRNVGLIENADGFGRVKNPINGYITEMYIKIENDQINDIKFKTIGCTVTIASASALSEAVKGKNLEEFIDGCKIIENLMNLIVEKIGNIPEKNWHCSPTAVQTFLTALNDYYKKNKDDKSVQKLEKSLNDVKNYFVEYMKKNFNS
jgi:nitrogen fixation NifU-like protein